MLLDLERSLYVCVEDESVEKLRRGFHPHDAVDLLLRLLQDRDAAQRNLYLRNERCARLPWHLDVEQDIPVPGLIIRYPCTSEGGSG